MSAQDAADRIKAQREEAGELGKVRPHATQVVKGRATTTVTVAGSAPGLEGDLDEVLDVALAAAGETRDSLFGWNVGASLDDGSRRVELHTD